MYTTEPSTTSAQLSETSKLHTPLNRARKDRPQFGCKGGGANYPYGNLRASCSTWDCIGVWGLGFRAVQMTSSWRAGRRPFDVAPVDGCLAQ